MFEYDDVADAPRPPAAVGSPTTPAGKEMRQRRVQNSNVAVAASPQSTPPVMSAEGSRQDDQQIFGGIEFPAFAVEAVSNDADGEAKHHSSLLPNVDVIEFGLNSPTATLTQQQQQQLSQSKKGDDVAAAQEQQTKSNNLQLGTNVALQPSHIAFEHQSVGGGGGGGGVASGQYTATAIGPMFGPRKQLRQMHPLFDESAATHGGGKATRRRAGGEGGASLGGRGDDSLCTSRSNNESSFRGLFSPQHNGAVAVETDAEPPQHLLRSPAIEHHRTGSDNNLLRRRRNINLLHIFDQHNRWYSSWMMTFVDASMELEYLRFFYQPKRVAVLGYCIIVVIVAVIVQLLYASVELPVAARILYIVATLVWVVAGVFSYQLKQEALEHQKIAEEEELGVRAVDELLEGEVLDGSTTVSPPGANVLRDKVIDRKSWSTFENRNNGNEELEATEAHHDDYADEAVPRQTQEEDNEHFHHTSVPAKNNRPQQHHQPIHRTQSSESSHGATGTLFLLPSVEGPDEGSSGSTTATTTSARKRGEAAAHDSGAAAVQSQRCADDMQSATRLRVQGQAEMTFELIAKRLGKNYEAFCDEQEQQQAALGQHKRGEKNDSSPASKRILGHNKAMGTPPRNRGNIARNDNHWNPITITADPIFELQQQERQKQEERRKRLQRGLYDSDDGSEDEDEKNAKVKRTLSRAVIEEQFLSQWNSKSRIRLRLNAVRTERVMALIIFGNFLMCYANYIGKGDCTASNWSVEESERGCSKAIQSDGIVILLIIAGAFFNQTRLKLFLPLYVVLLGFVHGLKWIPGLLDVHLVYFWSAFVVFNAEAAVCIGLILFHERNTRVECKMNIRCYVKNREAAQVRRQAERTVGAQVPVEVLRMAMVLDKRRSAESSLSRNSRDTTVSAAEDATQLWAWSEHLTYCCVNLDGYAAWKLLRGPSQIVELTQAVLNLFDRVRMRCISSELHAPIPKAHRFGDCYSVFLIPPSGAIQDVREAVEVAAGFALLCITEGTDLIKRRFQNEVTWGNAASTLHVRASLAVGPSGGSLLSETRNVVVVGSVVEETREMLTACGGVTQWREVFPQLYASQTEFNGGVHVNAPEVKSRSPRARETAKRTKKKLYANDAEYFFSGSSAQQVAALSSSRNAIAPFEASQLHSDSDAFRELSDHSSRTLVLPPVVSIPPKGEDDVLLQKAATMPNRNGSSTATTTTIHAPQQQKANVVLGCSHSCVGHTSSQEAKRVVLASDDDTGVTSVYQCSVPLSGQLSLNFKAAEALGLLVSHKRHIEALQDAAATAEEEEHPTRSSAPDNRAKVSGGESVCNTTCTYVSGFDRRSVASFVQPRTVPAAVNNSNGGTAAAQHISAEAHRDAILTKGGNVFYVPITIHPPQALQCVAPRISSWPPPSSGEKATPLVPSLLESNGDHSRLHGTDEASPNAADDEIASNPFVLPQSTQRLLRRDGSGGSYGPRPALDATARVPSAASLPPQATTSQQQRSAYRGGAVARNIGLSPVSSMNPTTTTALQMGELEFYSNESPAGADDLTPPPPRQAPPTVPPAGVVIVQPPPESAIHQSAAERVELTVDYTFRTRFLSDKTEAEYQAYRPANTTWAMTWSTTASLISTAALATVCGISGTQSFVAGEPLFWAVISMVCAIVAYIAIFFSAGSYGGGDSSDLWWFLHVAISIAIQGFYIAAIGVADHATLIGDSQMVWLFVMTNWSLHRPALVAWYWAWVRDSIVGGLAIARTVATFDIPGSVYTLSMFFGIAHIVYSYLMQWMMEHSRRESFALERHVGILKEEQERDFQDLLKTLTDMVPRGVAGNLVRRAKQRLSTSFCTATEETPFLLIQLRDDGTGNKVGPSVKVGAHEPSYASGTIESMQLNAPPSIVGRLGSGSSAEVGAAVGLVRVGSAGVVTNRAIAAQLLEVVQMEGHEARAEQRALATLQLVQFVLEYAASAACPFQKQLQVVKADHDTIRSHDVLAFSVDVAKAVEGYLDKRYRRVPAPHGNKPIRSPGETSERTLGHPEDNAPRRMKADVARSLSRDAGSLTLRLANFNEDNVNCVTTSHRTRGGEKNIADATMMPRNNYVPAFRVVAATGPLMGSVVGVTSLSFEYYGAWVGRAMGLLGDVEWGSIVATERVYNFHRLFVEAASLGRVAAIGRYKALPVSEVTRAEKSATAAAQQRLNGASGKKNRGVTSGSLPAVATVRLKLAERLPVPELLPSVPFCVPGGGVSTPIRIVFVKKDAEEFQP
ncbi:transmembrane protein, putative [Bodo saltans]|uniref:Transmembrane protein, putative n=1 Tax=Bodo saltans TaxID=75058 RepID=A0A0S4JT96_BODSA|nr:transmembrane protein, putative [Bodo saltans]|eukprot:CUG93586.1 transmembrane protein, putative [Bodo saltans]